MLNIYLVSRLQSLQAKNHFPSNPHPKLKTLPEPSRQQPEHWTDLLWKVKRKIKEISPQARQPLRNTRIWQRLGQSHAQAAADFGKGIAWPDSDMWIVPAAFTRLRLARLFRTRLSSSTCEFGGSAITHPSVRGAKGLPTALQHTGPAMGSLLQHWAHGNPNLKQAVPKGGAGGGKKQQEESTKQHAQTPRRFHSVRASRCLPHSPSPLSKIKTKINHEGKEGKTSPKFMFVLGLLQQLLYWAFICLCGVS